jgi:nucleoside-diphosphate-sugar epimerase
LIDVRNTDAAGNLLEGVEQHDLRADDAERFRHVFSGCDAVVHLGYHRPAGGGMDDWKARGYDDERKNVDMAERVYRLSLEEGVRRVVVASSNHAADWYEELIHVGRMDVVDPERTPPRSDNVYGWAKFFYEALGFLYASGSQGRKLENVQVRIGAPREIEARTFFPDGPGGDGDAVRYKRDLGAYISARDLAQLFVRSLEARSIDDEHGVPFQVFYGISGNARAFWSIVNARRVIGDAPEDDAELRFADEIRRYLVEPLAAHHADAHG